MFTKYLTSFSKTHFSKVKVNKHFLGFCSEQSNSLKRLDNGIQWFCHGNNVGDGLTRCEPEDVALVLTLGAKA